MSLTRLLCAPFAPPLCFACGAFAGRVEPLCAVCRRALSWLPRVPVLVSGVAAWAPLAYAGPARALVQGLKFRAARGLAGPMAAQIAAGAPRGWLANAALVPVPAHPARARRRGFNQAEALASELRERTGLPVCDCLRRDGPRARQVGRGRADRLAAVAGTVGLRPGVRAPPAAVLVDDVITTGATLAACAVALRGAGAAEVRALAYARTPGR